MGILTLETVAWLVTCGNKFEIEVEKEWRKVTVKLEKIKQEIIKLGQSVLGEKRWNRMINLKIDIQHPGSREHFESYGDLNPDKTIYLIRRKIEGGAKGFYPFLHM